MIRHLVSLVFVMNAVSCTQNQLQINTTLIISMPSLSGKSPVYDIELKPKVILFTGIKNTTFRGKYVIPITKYYYEELYKQLEQESTKSKDRRRDFYKIKLIINTKKTFIKSSSEPVEKLLKYINTYLSKKQRPDKLGL